IPALAAGESLKEARTAWLRGNYGEARDGYAELAKKPASKEAGAVGVSKGHQSLGDWKKAQEAIDAALGDLPKDADLLARRAELLYLRGQWGGAEKRAGAARKQN